ncbi:glycosyltransferase [Ferruginibacter albus]|uniref:glycosyltransferase n=1 Tax=Ferruginibacter albus TaxID=2875540 RepID=UPI001CC731B8|nr:glycosyltransferase [Ferruginibacter albus]UAY51825.1 glycosyltransferase [Ferruginibacter albus]
MLAAILLITVIFFLGYAVLIGYYYKGWKQSKEVIITSTHFSASISVIIPARNEENNIKACLNAVLSQNYPAHLFEVIVVDDHSDDKTAEIVRSFNTIRLISLKDFTGNEKLNSYKKKAIETAIAQAQGDLIVTTDADCIPSKNWLSAIASFYEQKKSAFIAGPVCYFNSDKLNFIETFESLDFMSMQGITAASVNQKFHSMCNGANLAYEKKAFIEVGGFKGIDNIASGDDMLLMHKIYTRYPDRVDYLKSKDAIVETQPMSTLSAFFNQRIRWASKADKYDDKRIFWVLLFVYLFNCWFIILFIYSLFTIHYSLLLGSLITKTVIELVLMIPVTKFFSRQKLLWWFPIAQPFHILYIIIAGWLGKFGSYKWKDRKIK